jgi:iron complex outermembrane receptor protein
VNPKDKTCLEQAGADDSVLGNVCDFFDDQGVTSYRGAFITGNNSSAEIEGYEVGLNWDLTETTWLRAAYAYADAVADEPRTVNPLELRTKHDYVPDLTYSLLVAHQFPQNIQLSAAYYHLEELDWAGEGNRVPAYHRLDMRLAKSFTLAGVSGKLALIMQNMQDEYVDFQHENIMRERTYVSLDLFFR